MGWDGIGWYGKEREETRRIHLEEERLKRERKIQKHESD